MTAFIGPSGCGKSTFLRTLNRMHEVIPGAYVQGSVAMDGIDMYGADVDPVAVRRQVGMVFQRPNPFPTMSIADNVLAGIKLNNKRISKSDAADVVETSLRSANLWNEVKDRLNRPGSGLSGGQQQRLCIARAIAVKPQVLLMDEPCSALDPISTLAIEDLIAELKTDYTIVIVTHNMQQAARVSDRTAFFNLAGDRAAWPPGRDRRDVDDLLLAARAGHGGLHLGPLRLSPGTTTEGPSGRAAPSRSCGCQLGRRRHRRRVLGQRAVEHRQVGRDGAVLGRRERHLQDRARRDVDRLEDDARLAVLGRVAAAEQHGLLRAELDVVESSPADTVTVRSSVPSFTRPPSRLPGSPSASETTSRLLPRTSPSSTRIPSEELYGSAGGDPVGGGAAGEREADDG